MWVIGALISAILLGIYNLSQKAALKNNAVLSVLLLSTAGAALIFLPLILFSYFNIIPDTNFFYVPKGNFDAHWHILLKACIVFSSWFFGYYAIKHLAITLVGPVKATQPVFTLIGATLLLGEVLNIYQWIGVLLGISSIFLLSYSGKNEGIDFRKNKFIWLLFTSVVIGAISSLYDKYLLQHYNRMFVQSWFLLDQTILTAIVFLFLYKKKTFGTTKFQWRYSIILISVFIALADLVYFWALSKPGAMISIVSMIRRSSVLVSFIGGVIIFKENNIKSKAFDLILILLGLIFLYFGSK